MNPAVQLQWKSLIKLRHFTNYVLSPLPLLSFSSSFLAFAYTAYTRLHYFINPYKFKTLCSPLWQIVKTTKVRLVPADS